MGSSTQWVKNCFQPPGSIVRTSSQSVRAVSVRFAPVRNCVMSGTIKKYYVYLTIQLCCKKCKVGVVLDRYVSNSQTYQVSRLRRDSHASGLCLRPATIFSRLGMTLTPQEKKPKWQ